MKRFWALLLCMLCFASSSQAQGALWRIDTESIGINISPTLYGVFFEDINYAADGGLYAELLRNRSFEYRNLQNPTKYDALTGWMFNHRNKGTGSAELLREAPIHPNNPDYMRVTVEGGDYRIVNVGFPKQATRPGITIKKDAEYRFSIWLRQVDFDGELLVALEDSKGGLISNEIVLKPDGTDFHKYEGFRLAAVADGTVWLRIVVRGTGTFDMDMASLLPKDCYGAAWQNGGLRSDLVQALKDLKPSFLRFPGGCIVEGSYFKSNVYSWKDTIGPLETRKENENTWGYMQSYGLGFHEYFQLCEDIGALPLPVVHAGLLCQARGTDEPPTSKVEMGTHIQDVLDLLEYALGGTDTVWGKKRVENGHPQPFDLRYLAIGNENWGAEYFSRYGQIEKAVKAAYPDIVCIAAAGPVAEGGLFDDNWRQIRAKFPFDMVDEHYYMASDWFLQNVNRYGRYNRKGNPIFLGEYAAHEPAVAGKRPNNLYGALCEAAYMTGIERNSDLVRLCCYAPLFARDGFAQWTPDMIWFNESNVLKTPNYYVQQIFSATKGDYLLEDACEEDGVYTLATTSGNTIQLKAVNVSGEKKAVDIVLAGSGFTGEAAGVILGGDNKAVVNTFGSPDQIGPADITVTFRDGKAVVSLPEYGLISITVPVL